MKKLKASFRVEQRRDGITCVVTRYIQGHGRPFHSITESSQERVSRLLSIASTCEYFHVECGSIALVALFYCEAEK